jgi:hypothetical protein
MRFLALLFLFVGSSLSAAPLFNFGLGNVELPTSTTDHPKRGIDSSVGTLESTDGTPTINYDIGLGGSEHPNIKPDDYLFFEKGKIGKSVYYITIAKSDPSNLNFAIFQPEFAGFWAYFSNEDQRQKILRIYHIFTSYKAEQGAAANP